MRITLFTLLFSLAVPAMVTVPALLPEELPLHLRPRPENVGVISPEVDLNGLWVGELLQNAGGIAERFDLSMQLVHNGIFLKGTAFVKYEEIWAEMEVSGFQQANGSWKLTDIKVLRAQKPKELSWCEKSYELRASFTPEGVVLHGPWWGNSEYGPCIPGSIRLKRKIKSA
ncbi:hypothetical protein [Neolewinella agarilytica]|uniref:hypothetical protein n=1 Tax=Neolewinella agarilytica TaxID=478744 RepID=UPI00235689A7|nr:hypothetical protein [Neolewinella agarilytica]